MPELKRFWVSVVAYSHHGLRDDWPDHVQGFLTGSEVHSDRGTWCLIIDVPSISDVQAILRSLWSSWEIRFGPHEKPGDWVPGDRFPGAWRQEVIR